MYHFKYKMASQLCTSLKCAHGSSTTSGIPTGKQALWESRPYTVQHTGTSQTQPVKWVTCRCHTYKIIFTHIHARERKENRGGKGKVWEIMGRIYIPRNHLTFWSNRNFQAFPWYYVLIVQWSEQPESNCKAKQRKLESFTVDKARGSIFRGDSMFIQMMCAQGLCTLHQLLWVVIIYKYILSSDWLEELRQYGKVKEWFSPSMCFWNKTMGSLMGCSLHMINISSFMQDATTKDPGKDCEPLWDVDSLS